MTTTAISTRIDQTIAAGTISIETAFDDGNSSPEQGQFEGCAYTILTIGGRFPLAYDDQQGLTWVKATPTVADLRPLGLLWLFEIEDDADDEEDIDSSDIDDEVRSRMRNMTSEAQDEGDEDCARKYASWVLDDYADDAKLCRVCPRGFNEFLIVATDADDQDSLCNLLDEIAHDWVNLTWTWMGRDAISEALAESFRLRHSEEGHLRQSESYSSWGVWTPEDRTLAAEIRR